MTSRSQLLPIATFVAGLSSIVLFFLLLKTVSFQPYIGDEYIYFYQGKLVADGATPYRDFAMAHPPLQSVLAAVYLKAAGLNIFTMRLLPIGFCLLSAIILALMVRREHGIFAGLLAPIFFLFAYEPLRALTHFTGVNMTVAFLLMTVYQYRLGHLKIAALFAVFAIFTRLYATPTIAALIVFSIAVSYRQGLRLMFYGTLIGMAMLISCGLWTGFADLAHNILLYHARKTPMSGNALVEMKTNILFHHAIFTTLFALATSAMAYVIGRAYFTNNPQLFRRRRLIAAVEATNTALPLLSALIAIVMLIILTRMNRIWMYYFVPVFPFAATVAAWFCDRIAKGLIRRVHTGGKLPATGMRYKDAVLGLAAVVVLALSYLGSPKLEQSLGYYQREIQKPLEDRTHLYTFTPSTFAPGISSFIEQIFWLPARVIGESYTTVNYYLWHESRIFDLVDETVTIITTETGPGDEIFGDSGTVPLFALLSGRAITGNKVDTNIQRYRSNNADRKALIAKIDRVQTKLIILRHRFGVSGIAELYRKKDSTG